MTPSGETRDQALLRVTREFLRGCSCSEPGRPQDCQECLDGFVKAALHFERLYSEAERELQEVERLD